jgi:cobalt/nickel transport system permease protein
MHIAEGLLPPLHAGIGFVAAAPALALSVLAIQRAYRNGEARDRALLTMGSALILALTLFPIPVPGLGATSHMCVTPALALLANPVLFTFPTALALLFQALFLAHGGITTLGVNTFTLGFVGPLVSFTLAFYLLRFLPPSLRSFIAITAGSLSVYLADALILAFSLAGGDSAGPWFLKMLAAFAPIQVPLSIVEGLLGAILVSRLHPFIISQKKASSMLLGLVFFLGALSSIPLKESLAHSKHARPKTLPVVTESQSRHEERGEPASPSEPEILALDSHVFASTANKAGRSVKDPPFAIPPHWSDALFYALLFVCGLIAGHEWKRIKAIGTAERDNG